MFKSTKKIKDNSIPGQCRPPTNQGRTDEATTNVQAIRSKLKPYVWCLPDEATFLSHFSNIFFFSGDTLLTTLEILVLGTLAYLGLDSTFDVCGSCSAHMLFLYVLASSLFRRVYNTYLEGETHEIGASGGRATE